MKKKGLRPDEEWARAMISQALDVPVEQHDDGSRQGMHDLDIVHNDEARAAVEVTAAADAASIELWNLMNGDHRRWQVEGLQGGWMVSLEPTRERTGFGSNSRTCLCAWSDFGEARFIPVAMAVGQSTP